jgi:hypothetical protein
MKLHFLFSILIIFSHEFTFCQNLSIGLTLGLNNSFSNFYDTEIDPQKTFTVTRPLVGFNLKYTPFKKHSFFLNTGLQYLEFANSFKIEDAPYFGHKEGFEKVNQNYSSFKIPLRMGFRQGLGKQFGIGGLLGGSFLQTNRSSFTEHIDDVQRKTINKSDYELEYNFSFRSINKSTFTVDAGVTLFYDINKKVSVEAILLQQLGLTPILSSILEYKIINKTNPFTLNGDAYITSKGDAVSLAVSINYKFGKQ